MPRIGSFVEGLYRDESRTTGELVAALCKAVMEYLPVELDETGYRDGQAYKYASIHSIRRSTLAANCKHGLFLNHVYSQSDKGEHVTSVLRHQSGEFMASTSAVPALTDVQEAKAAKTLLCRTHSEGLLGIVTERDDDGASAAQPVDAAQQDRWAATWNAAKAAIANAADVESVNKYEFMAKQRVEAGSLSPDVVPEIERMCRERRDHLTERKRANADSASTADVEESNVAGGGDRAPNRRNGRGAVGVG